ncbi:MAG TPA: type II toxin-antitoxin system prevent-host-death family antitoxin [Terriglobales bacterium]|nr:type II toxin-antitoxin system prevent-host-death family antitoxin [Terriglobales bacterium]
MATVGVGELKNALSAFVRRAEAGEMITITVQGRPVAQLVPMEERVRPPLEKGPLTEDWPTLRDPFPPGTAAQWVDEDRGDD